MDPTGQTIGGTLVVDKKYRYSDLDELIVNHVQAMGRRVEDLMAHEKFKHGPEDDLRALLHFSLFERVLITVGLHIRSLPEELCDCKPFQEYVWLHVKQEASRAFQSMLPC